MNEAGIQDKTRLDRADTSPVSFTQQQSKIWQCQDWETVNIHMEDYKWNVGILLHNFLTAPKQ